MSNKRKARRASSQKKSRPAPRQAGRQASGRRWVRPAIWGVGLAAVVVGVVFIVTDVSENPQQRPNEEPDGVEVVEIGDYSHIEGAIAYDRNPPAGGNHSSAELPCQAYDQPVSNELAVHSLEHGAVWITYQPELSEDDIGTLRGYARRSEVIVSPYPGLDAPVVVTAWGRQMQADSADDERIDQFVRFFINQTAPENFATC
jgi:hypothetical protein